jgi:hypothetical protein
MLQSVRNRSGNAASSKFQSVPKIRLFAPEHDERAAFLAIPVLPDIMVAPGSHPSTVVMTVPAFQRFIPGAEQFALTVMKERATVVGEKIRRESLFAALKRR